MVICANPIMVMFRQPVRPALRLEFFGTQQRIEEVEAKQRGDDQPDHGFQHGEAPSKARAGAGICPDNEKEQNAKAEIDKIVHDGVS